MENLSFVIWMLGWPCIVFLESFLYKILGVKIKVYSNSVEVLSGLIFLFIWIYVGSLLYKN